MADADPIRVPVDASADEAALARLQTTIEGAIEKGFKAGFAGLGTILGSSLNKEINPLLEKLKRNVQEALSGGSSKAARANFDNITASLTRAETAAANFVVRMHELDASTGEVIAQTNKLSSDFRRNSIAQTTTAQQASLERIALTRKETVESNISGQLAVVQARAAGKSRLQIARALFENIARLEKAIGATISGVARTAVSAFSRIASGVGGALSTLFRRNNSELSSGLNSSLKVRESELRSSFSRQERTLRESVSRQERILTGLQEKSNTGIVGAARRSGLLGVGLGFAALGAIKSTFTIGADFTRGLAVLQSQLGLTADQMKSVRQLSIDLGNDISLPGVSALDAAQAIQILTKTFGSLGPAAVGAAEKAAKGTLQLARAAGVGAEDAAAIIGAAVNVFGISADKAVSVADLVAGALARAAGVSFENFKDSFVQGATVFNSFVGRAEDANSTLLDFNTTLAILAKNGIVGGVAGAGLKQFFLQANQQTKGALKATAEVTKRAKVSGSIFFDGAGKARKFADSIEILRKGTEGLTDAERSNVLGQLFGSKSRTIAEALINSTGESFAELRKQVQVEGLAAKIAAAQNTGLKGALDAAKSVMETVQILLFEKVNPALGKFVLTLTEGVNAVLFGAAPAFALLRRALLGVAVGMGAILAVKAAVEVMGLLGKAAGLVLSPFGALLAVAGLLGAAISVLLDRSAPLRETVKVLGDRFGLLGDKLKNLVKPALEAISRFIDNTVIPAVDSFAQFLSDHLIGAFDATVRFITGKVIPGLKSFAGFIHDEVFPVVGRLAGVVTDGFGTALDVIKRFWAIAEPFLRPAIDGLKTLGSAIADALGGNFGNLGSGLVTAGKGIGSTFAKIGTVIFEALKPVGEKIVSFFVGLFSGPNLAKYGNAALNIVETVGRILGTIVTHPTFIKALAAIAAAAVIVGFNFIKGFAEGVISNLPGLFDLGKQVVGAIIDGIVNNPALAAGAIIAIQIIRNFKALKTLFAQAGAEAGSAYGGGLTQALARVGKAAAITLGAGLASALSGRAFAQSSGILDKAISLGGIVMSGITAGIATGNPLIGVAVAGVGLLTAAFSGSGQAAEVTRKKVKAYADVLDGQLKAGLLGATTGQLDFNAALLGNETIQNQIIATLGPKTIATLIKLGFGLGDITKAFTGGDKAVKILVDSIADLGGDNLINGVSDQEAAALSLISAYDTLATAIKQANDEAEFKGGNVLGTATALGNIFSTLGTPFPAINVEGPTSGLQEIIDKQNEFLTKNNDIVSALQAGFPTSASDTFQAVLDNAIIASGGLGQNIADIQKQIAEGSLVPVIGDAQIRQSLATIPSTLSALIGEGLQQGLITTPDDVLPLVQSFRESLLAGLDPATQQGLIDQINGVFNSALTALDPQVKAFINNLTPALGDFTTELGQTALSQFTGSTIPPIEVTIKPTFTAESVTASANALAGAFSSAVALNVVPTPPLEVQKTAVDSATSLGQSVGKPFGEGVARGLALENLRVTNAAIALARAAKTAFEQEWGIASPSKVAIGIGHQIGAGLAIGLQDSTASVTNIISTALDDAINAALTTASRGAAVIQGAVAGLFGKLTGSDALGLGGSTAGALPSAQAGVTTALQSFLSTFDSNVAKVLDVNKKKAKDRSSAEKDIFGESKFSLNVADVIGASNFQALTSAFDAIATLGDTLLAQGVSASLVSDTLRDQVNNLIATAVGLGFKKDDVQALADALGLSGDALADFLRQAQDLANGVVAGGVAQGPLAQRLPRTIENINIYPVSGDAEAIALETANRLAALSVS